MDWPVGAVEPCAVIPSAMLTANIQHTVLSHPCDWLFTSHSCPSETPTSSSVVPPQSTGLGIGTPYWPSLSPPSPAHCPIKTVVTNRVTRPLCTANRVNRNNLQYINCTTVPQTATVSPSIMAPSPITLTMALSVNWTVSSTVWLF